jgi:hypothetical protein
MQLQGWHGTSASSVEPQTCLPVVFRKRKDTGKRVHLPMLPENIVWARTRSTTLAAYGPV